MTARKAAPADVRITRLRARITQLEVAQGELRGRVEALEAAAWPSTGPKTDPKPAPESDAPPPLDPLLLEVGRRVQAMAGQVDRISDLQGQLVATLPFVVEAIREQRSLLGKVLGPLGNLEHSVAKLVNPDAC